MHGFEAKRWGQPWWFAPAILAVVLGAAIGGVALEHARKPPSPTAESLVAAYLAATSAGNEQAALDAWHEYPVPELNTNGWRTELTHLLASEHVGRSYTVTKVHYELPYRAASERDATHAALLVEATGDMVWHRLVFGLNVKGSFFEPSPASPRSGGEWVLYSVAFGECNDQMQGWHCDYRENQFRGTRSFN
jgi:hypothetical protein